MVYQAEPIPHDLTELRDVILYLERELLRVSQASEEGLARSLEMQYVAPSKPREGLLVLADGTRWNPGAGQGVYVYYASAWHFLG